VLALPRLGCINIHASLLPRWRGAAPIHRAIEAGDAQTGITIMQMDAGLDTGDMLLAQAVAITPQDTTASLHDTLAALGARLIVSTLQALASGRASDTLARQPQPQADSPQAALAGGITYAHKIDKSEAAIDWSQSALTLARRVRAFDPAPACTAQIGGEVIKVWCCEIDSKLSLSHLDIGHILAVSEQGVVVQTGEGALTLTQLQRPGGKRMAAALVARALGLQAGMRFESGQPSA
jgi:methionyl-tRNA formyltransferase